MPTADRAPYSVTPVSFRFVALARLAGSLPLGQGRESALAALLVARLVESAVLGTVLPAATAKRAASGRKWLQSLCPDKTVCAATAAVCDAIIEGDVRGVGLALARVTEVTAPILSSAARSELTAMVALARG